MSDEIIVYQIGELVVRLRPASRSRAWMDDLPERFGNRCLPMLIANQCGWDILSPCTVIATWDGSGSPDGVSVTTDGSSHPAHSHFGAGILTWEIPALFRTPRGINLWVRGPANEPRKGIVALDGIVETDWAAQTFTMNWKFTQPDTVIFEKDAPMCTVVPFPRHFIERFEPVVTSLAADSTVQDTYEAWRASREEFNKRFYDDATGGEHPWQRHYFQGTDVRSGRPMIEDHQTKLDLKTVRYIANEPAPEGGPS